MTQLNIEKYVRKPFAVEAVEVTEENLSEVAKWCKGRVRTANPNKEGGPPNAERYIQVQVKNARDERQTRAYVGDWVLSSGRGPLGFKVYTPQAFQSSFQKEVDRMFQVVERMEARAEQEEKLEFDEDIPSVNFSNSVR